MDTFARRYMVNGPSVSSSVKLSLSTCSPPTLSAAWRKPVEDVTLHHTYMIGCDES